MSTINPVAQHRECTSLQLLNKGRGIYISSDKWYPEVSCCLRAWLYHGPMHKHSTICGRIKSKSLTLSIKEQFWTRSSRLLKTLRPPTAGNVSMCGEESVCPTTGQPLGADIPPHLQRATIRNGLQGIHLGKQHHVGLHLLTYPPLEGYLPPDEQRALLLCVVMLRSHLPKSRWPWTSSLRKVTRTQGSLYEVEKWGQPLALISGLRKGYRSQMHSQQ